MADLAARWRGYDGIEHRVPQRVKVSPIENALLPASSPPVGVSRGRPLPCGVAATA
jgi:hypothetical protein